MANKQTDRISKSLWILRHEGPFSLAEKTMKHASKKIGKRKKISSSEIPEAYNYLANPIFQIDQKDITRSMNINNKSSTTPKSSLWFVPYFDHIKYGGIYTIFRFMEHFAKQGVATTIVIFDNKYLDKQKTYSEIIEHFPGLVDCELIILDLENETIEDLPERDMAFATIWMSAYLLLKYNQTKRKYYFIQDYEPLFYEGGAMYAMAESTYRFGFTGIVNTPGLLWAVNQRHALEGVSFIPAVDARYYYPATKKDNKRVRIFFYARPNNPRNAFELGVQIINQLLDKYGDRIEVITAGAKWDEGLYGLSGKINNLGLLNSLEAVGDLYRTCDIGFVYMLSKHPSYQPFEFMASGMATVSNRNEDNLWLFKDGENCLLSEPSPHAFTEKIGMLIDDEVLRKKISQTGQKNVNFDWNTELENIANYILQNKN